MNGEQTPREALATDRQLHTPGPWSIGDTVGTELMIYRDDALGSRVADCTSSGHGITRQQDHANARLIAAAPELYAICRDMLDWVHGKRERRAVTNELTGRLRAAINKVEGRS